MSNPINIFSHGGGTQSAAITALIVQGRLPKPDFVCIVDTERERSTTWEYLDAVIRPALRTVGLEVHRIMASEWASIDTNEGNTLLLPAFSDQNPNSVSKLDGFCSDKWKVRVMQRYWRSLGVATKFQRKWIGYSLDESRRAVRMRQGKEYRKGLIFFPLIDGIPLRRQQAIREVEKMGWPTPPRSRCRMCPNQQDDEWREVKENSPEEFAEACALEKEVQKKDPFAWFHRSCIPLGEVDFSKPDDLFDRACSSGGCFT